LILSTLASIFQISMTSALSEIDAFLPISPTLTTSGQPTSKQFSDIRPLAKVANDRHNLAQIARNCRYQQLN
jgi:hypothetical protein